MKAWMIRKKGTFLYSTAGSVPSFKPRAKVFYRRSDLLCHLKYFAKYQSHKNPYVNCEIVEFNVVESDVMDINREMAMINL